MLLPRPPLLALFLAAMSAAPLCGRVQAAPDSALDRPAYLISQQRYRDAADTLAGAQTPYDIRTLACRATLLLYAGRPGAAATQFAKLTALLPPSEQSLPLYGEGLCALMMRNGDEARAKLDRAAPGAADHAPEVAAARAACAVALGDNRAAAGFAASSDLPAAKEIAVTTALRAAPADSASVDALRALSQTWTQPGGVPHVSEGPGLRVLGACDPAPGRAAIEPAIGSWFDCDAVADRLSQNPGRSAAPAPHVSGSITLIPRLLNPRQDDIVTYYIDHDLKAAVNSTPFSYRWDTASSCNGPHTVTIVASNSASGSIQSESQRFDVENAASPESARAAIELSDADRVAVDDAWFLLTLRPSFRAAELVLARAEARVGNRDASLQHLTTAAAIDFDYAGGAQVVGAQFAGAMPAWFAQPASAHAGAKSMGIWRGRADQKVVALTFDDGPSPTDTPPLLAALEAAQAQGTFFVVGVRAQAAPDLLRRMHADGDEVEDHSYTHPNLDQAIPEHIYEEILRDAVIIRACTGVWPHFMRPPGGQSNTRVLQAAQTCGMAGAFWTIDVLPAEDSGSPDNVVNLVLGKLRPGAIVLMHNGAVATTQAIPRLARELRARGYRLVTLLELACGASSIQAYNGTKTSASVFQR